MKTEQEILSEIQKENEAIKDFYLKNQEWFNDIKRSIDEKEGQINAINAEIKRLKSMLEVKVSIENALHSNNDRLIDLKLNLGILTDEDYNIWPNNKNK